MIKWSLVFVCALALASAQNGYSRDRPDNQFGYDNSAQDYQDEDGSNGGEIPGEAGRDYPVYSEVPETSFSCSNQQYPGYYADPEAQCQAFYICQRGGKTDSFLCPNGTVFNQEYLVCDWWYNFDCNNAESLYSVNEQVLRAMEEADARLGQQGQGGYESQVLSPEAAHGAPQRNGNGFGNGLSHHGNGNGNGNGLRGNGNGNGNRHHGNGNGNGNGHHGNGNDNGNGHHGNGNGNGNGHHGNVNSNGNGYHGNGNALHGGNNGIAHRGGGNGNDGGNAYEGNFNNHHGNGNGNGHHGNGNNKNNGNGKYHGNELNGQNGISSQYGVPANRFNGGNTDADFSHGNENVFGHANGNGHDNGYANGNGVSQNGNGNRYPQNHNNQNGHGNGNSHHGNGSGNGHHGNGNGFSNELSAFRNGLGNGPALSGQSYQASQQNGFANGNGISSQYGLPNQGSNGQSGFNGSPFSGNAPERSYLPSSKK